MHTRHMDYLEQARTALTDAAKAQTKSGDHEKALADATAAIAYTGLAIAGQLGAIHSSVQIIARDINQIASRAS